MVAIKGRRLDDRVPTVIFVALVVSTVAEGARPVMLVVGRTIGILEAKVRRPLVSTVNDGDAVAVP